MLEKEMCFRQFISFFIIYVFASTGAHSSQKDQIIEKLENIKNVSFKFSQIIKDKIEEFILSNEWNTQIEQIHQCATINKQNNINKRIDF